MNTYLIAAVIAAVAYAAGWLRRHHTARADTLVTTARIEDFERELADLDTVRAERDAGAVAYRELHAATTAWVADARHWRERYEADVIDVDKNAILLETYRDLRVIVMEPAAARAVHDLHSWKTGSWAALQPSGGPAPEPPAVRRETDRQRGRRVKNEHKALGTVSVA